MPRIPQIDNWRTPTMNPPQGLRGGMTVQPINTEGANAASRAIASGTEGMLATYRQLDNVGDQLREMGARLDMADQQTKLTNAQIALQGKMQELADQYQGRQDFDSMAESYKKDSMEAVKGIGDDLHGQYKLKFQQHLMAEAGRGYMQVKKSARQGKVDAFKASLNDAEELLSRKAAGAGYGTQEYQAARDDYTLQINGALSMGLIQPSDAQKRLQKFDENVDLVGAKQMIVADPLKAHAMLSSNKMFQNLDPLKRVNLQEEALTHARQQDMQREREENRAERMQARAEKARGQQILAKAANAEVTLPELRQMLKDGKISTGDFEHANRLLKDGLRGDDYTDMTKFVGAYAAIREGHFTKDDVISMEGVAVADKKKLLDAVFKAESGEEKLNKPMYKQDREIIKATLKPSGFMATPSAERDSAYAYAIEHYDKLIRRGMDNVEAREKVMNTWEPIASNMGGGIQKPPTIGTPDMDKDTFAAELNKAYEEKRITQQQYVENFNRWKALQPRTVAPSTPKKGGK